MSTNSILGLMIFIIGIVLLGFGINSTLAITEKVIEGVSGRYSDNTMWFILGGIAMIVGGGALALLGRSND